MAGERRSLVFVTECDHSGLRLTHKVLDHVAVDAASGPKWSRL
jgi:hypothetical protein